MTVGISLFGGTGCGRTPSGGVRDLDGLPLLTVTEEQRIGSVDDPDIGFSQLTRIDVDQEGNVYALDGLAREIRVFSPDGLLQRRIGGPGGGPGEFEASPRFGVSGDTVWTIDSRLNRITLFHRDGTVLSTGLFERVLVPLPTVFGFIRPLTMRPDGTFIGQMSGVGSSRGAAPSDVQPTDSIPVPFVVFAATGAILDTIGWAGRPPPRLWRPPSDDRREMDFIDVGGMRQMLPQPPTGLPWWDPTVDGYILTEAQTPENQEQGELTVTRIGLHGDTIFHTPLSYRASPYTEADLDSIAARAARGEAGGMLPIFMPGAPVPDNWRTIAQAVLARMDFPEFQMPIEYPWVSRDGSVWLRRQNVDSPVVRWVVLDPEGQPRGQVELPSDVRPLWHRDDTFWAVDLDDFDVPWLVRFRLGR